MTSTWPVWRCALAVAAACAAASCGQSEPAPAPAATVASFRVVPQTGPNGPVTEVAPARDAVQVALLLAGDPMPIDDLTAEIGRLGTLDDVRRWAVDPPGPGDGGASCRVVVPIYAVPAGDHVLTLWRGDAEVVARYRFRVP